jgi:hypothetical protein
LTVADAPPSFDVENIERHWTVMQDRFDVFSRSLRCAVDFCRASDVRLISSSLIDPPASLFPVIYYLSRQKNGSVPASQRTRLRTFLYVLLFNRFLSGRRPDARIRYLRKPLSEADGERLPLDEILKVMKSKQRHHHVATSIGMLNDHVRLALNIAQPTAARDTLSWQERAEVDHIFPQSKFRVSHADLVDDIGNLGYLGKLRNIQKNAEDPWEYFADVADTELREDFLIPDRTLLAKDRFREFVDTRRALILERVTAFLGL